MPNPTWPAFRRRYESRYLRHQRRNTSVSYTSAFNWLEKILNPQLLTDITTKALWQFWHKLTKTYNISANSAYTYIKKVRAALRWAHEHKLLKEQAPDFRCPLPREKRLPGKPLSDAQVQQVLDGQAPEVLFLLRGLLLSGMRVSEAEDLRWKEGWFVPRLELPRPMFEVSAKRDKDHQDRLLPMTDEFAEHLRSVPEEQREGYVFLPQLQDRKKLRQVVAEAGKKVVTRTFPKTKTVTAHDFRRTFASHWIIHCAPAVLMKLMRHATIETTMRYYATIASEEVGKAIAGVRVFG